MKSGKVLLGLVAGVATGALLGILFAPDKGTETRKKISKKGEDYAQGLKDKFNEFVESLTVKGEELKEEASYAVEEGKAMIKDAANTAIEHGKARVKDAAFSALENGQAKNYTK